MGPAKSLTINRCEPLFGDPFSELDCKCNGKLHFGFTNAKKAQNYSFHFDRSNFCFLLYYEGMDNHSAMAVAIASPSLPLWWPWRAANLL